MNNLKEKFLKMYANIPVGARTEVCAVVEGTAYTYRDIYRILTDDDGKVNQALINMEAMEIL